MCTLVWSDGKNPRRSPSHVRESFNQERQSAHGKEEVLQSIFRVYLALLADDIVYWDRSKMVEKTQSARIVMSC